MNCQAFTAVGRRCLQNVPAGKEFCIWHDEERALEAREVRQRGLDRSKEVNAAKAARAPIEADTPPPPLEQTLEGVARHQAWIAQQIVSGAMTPLVGNAATRALTNLRELVTKRDLEDMLKQARHEVAELRRRLDGKAA